MKRLAIPIAILVVILIIWLVQSKMETNRITGKVIENFLELDANDINKIVIMNNDDTLTFSKEQDNWFLLDSLPRRADSMAIGNMVTTAAEIRVGNVISQNIERQGDFMVDEIMGNLVRFYRDDILLNEVIIGKMASDRTHTYIRKPDSDEVYLAEGLLSYTFNRQKTQWLDKTIFSFVPGSITNVELIYPDRSLKLFAGDSLWYVAQKPYKDSIMADSIKMGAFLGIIGKLHANDFMNAADSGLVDFDNFSLKANISLIDGTAHSIEFAKVNEDNNRVYCRKSGLNEVFVIYISRFGTLKKKLSDFMP